MKSHIASEGLTKDVNQVDLDSRNCLPGSKKRRGNNMSEKSKREGSFGTARGGCYLVLNVNTQRMSSKMMAARSHPFNMMIPQSVFK